MTTLHDAYLTTAIETLGIERTVIALQAYAAQSHRTAVTCMLQMRRMGENRQRDARLMSKAIEFNLSRLDAATHWQKQQAWASLNARILMGIEE